MAHTAQQAYDMIKNLEAQGSFPLPLPSKTVHVGTFDAATGTFSYAIPTAAVNWYEHLGIGPNGKPIPPIKHTVTVGRIEVNAADLLLSFSVSNPKGSFTVHAGGKTVTINTDSVLSTGAAIRSRTVPVSAVTTALNKHTLTVDMGSFVTSPPASGEVPGLGVSLWSGSVSAEIQLEITRPPMFAAGALTMPAVPIALIYAPPPGAQNRNFAEYSDTTAISTKISTSVATGNSSKTATAYSTSDFIGKISGVVTSIQSLILAFEGDGWPGAQFVKSVGGSINLGLNLLSGILSDTTTNTTNTMTANAEHDLVTVDTDTSTFGTPAGLGPGAGDRFVYLRNVKIVWMIANGELSFTVLGSDGIRSFPAQELLADLNAISSSSGTVTAGPVTNLDAVTLQMLLGIDRFVGNPAPTLSGPRFVQNDPASAGGNGTDPNGDSFQVIHDVTMTDINTQTNVTTTVTDYKPGWLVALFGNNQSTENQATLTYSSGTQNSVERKQTATVHFFASPNDPPYLVGLYFDRLFGTFAFTPAQV